MDEQVSQKLVEVEYLDNDRIQVIRINGMTRQAVDEYINFIDREILQYDGNTVLHVHVFAKISGMLSPYFMGRLKEYMGAKLRTDLIGRVAIVSPSDIFRLLINPVVKLYSRRSDKLAVQIFTDVEEAIKWVSEYEA